jgi:hypothetical protein
VCGSEMTIRSSQIGWADQIPVPPSLRMDEALGLEGAWASKALAKGVDHAYHMVGSTLCPAEDGCCPAQQSGPLR